MQPTEVWTDLHPVTGSKGKSINIKINIEINTHTDKLSKNQQIKNREAGPQSTAANHEQSVVSKAGLILTRS